MKKLILAFGLMLSTITFAQSTGNVSLNVRLYPIQTIMVNPLQETVNLDYTTATDYSAGVSSMQTNHLSVYSTGGFIVSVKSTSASLTNTINSDAISSSDIKIVASEGSSNSMAGVTYSSPVDLSMTTTPLFSNSTGGVAKNFNVKYTAQGDLNAYINKYYNAQNPTVYSTTVVYEIAPN